MSFAYTKDSRSRLAQEFSEALWNGEKLKINILLKVMDAKNVNETADMSRSTPLHSACGADSEAVAKLLSIPGINVNARDCGGNTPIMRAAVCCNTEALRLMLDYPRVDLDIKNYDHVKNRLEDVVEVAYRANLHELTKCLKMIQEARIKREICFYKVFSQLTKLDKHTMGLHQDLFEALRSMDNHKVDELLEKMETLAINKAGAYRITPLHVACASNMGSVAKLLSIPGINVNARDSRGFTPIMTAADWCSNEALELMLDDPRVNLDVRNLDGDRLEDLVEISYRANSSEKYKYLEMITKAIQKERSETGDPNDEMEATRKLLDRLFHAGV